jgi:hypothetical protein
MVKYLIVSLITTFGFDGIIQNIEMECNTENQSSNFIIYIYIYIIFLSGYEEKVHMKVGPIKTLKEKVTAQI